ncbi:MAG: PIN domain-containing protein [Planctomycetes bacterium]|nr:PIN domain-containing protein [Planctomycetota bacterium]
MLIYLDSVIVIYLLDNTGSFNTRATHRLAALVAAGDRVAVSDLTRLECRVKPIKDGNPAKLADFDAFFTRPDVQTVPISTAVFDRATLIRATHNFKLADSLHLAAAVDGGCDRFLTNDTRLSRFLDIPVEVLP